MSAERGTAHLFRRLSEGYLIRGYKADVTLTLFLVYYLATVGQVWERKLISCIIPNNASDLKNSDKAIKKRKLVSPSEPPWLKSHFLKNQNETIILAHLTSNPLFITRVSYIYGKLIELIVDCLAKFTAVI